MQNPQWGFFFDHTNLTAFLNELFVDTEIGGKIK